MYAESSLRELVAQARSVGVDIETRLDEDLLRKEGRQIIETVTVRSGLPGVGPHPMGGFYAFERLFEAKSKGLLDVSIRRAAGLPLPAVVLKEGDSTMGVSDMNAARSMSMLLQVDEGIPGDEQESSFMNATLQSAGDLVDFSVSTSIDVPEQISAQGESAVKGYIEDVLRAACLAHPALSFQVQVGASREVEERRERDAGARG